MVNPKEADNTTHELAAGIGIYFEKHHLKWQTDGGVLLEENGPDLFSTPVVRTHLQLGF